MDMKTVTVDLNVERDGQEIFVSCSAEVSKEHGQIYVTKFASSEDLTPVEHEAAVEAITDKARAYWDSI